MENAGTVGLLGDQHVSPRFLSGGPNTTFYHMVGLNGNVNPGLCLIYRRPVAVLEDVVQLAKCVKTQKR